MTRPPEAVFGFFVGVLCTVLFATWVRDRGRDDCDNTLPRNQQCVQVWVTPDQAKLLGETK